MAQLADIIVRAMLPLHPRLAASPRLSIQLLARGNVLEETDAVTRDRYGVWEVSSVLKLPEGDQPLTLAVVIDGQNDKENLLSSTFNTKTLRAQANTRPDEYHEFISYNSLTQIRVFISCYLEISPPEIVSGGTRSQTLSEIRLPSLTGMTLPLKQEALKKAYADYMSLPNSDQKIAALSALGRAYHELYEQAMDPADLDRAIFIQKEAIQLGRSHPQLVQHLERLSRALEDIYDCEGNRTDIDEAIRVSQYALDLTRQDAPERAELLMRLGLEYDSRFTHLGDLADIDAAVSMLSEAVALVPEGSQKKAMGHNNLGTALLERFKHLGTLEDLDRAISSLENAVKLTPDGHPKKPSLYSNLGGARQFRFKHLGDLDDLNMAISNQETAMRLTPDGHPEKPSIHNNLAGALQHRFKRLGVIADLEMAIINVEGAVRLTPDGHPTKPPHYNNLGAVLQLRFKQLGRLSDLEKAITSMENAMNLTPDGHPSKPSRYSNLGIALQSRFERVGSLIDLEMAITNQENAVKLTPDGHPDKPLYYNNFGIALNCRFERLGVLSDLEMAISNMENAVKVTPAGHVDRIERYSNLGGFLLRRFERLGALSDLTMAITYQENAVKLTPDGHPDKPERYDRLGTAMQRRFERLGDLADLERAIISRENAVKLTSDGLPDKPLRYNNLGNAFQRRFEHLGDLADLEMAISNHKNAMRLTPDGHSNKPSHYNCLGTSLHLRFKRLGDLTDLETAITYLENAVNLTPNGHTDRLAFCSNLGNALQGRFERLGVLSDLEMAITILEDAVGLMPDEHSNKPLLCTNLGQAFRSRFDRLDHIVDLEMAISNYENAVNLTPNGHPDKPSRYNNLANSLKSRFERLGDLNDLEMAINNLESAVNLTPDGHADKASFYTNLGSVLQHRFKRLGTLSDLERAISNKEHAVRLEPDGHPNRVFMTINLASSYEACFRSSAKRLDLEMAHSLYATAAQSPVGRPQQRFDAALKWSRCAKFMNTSPLPAFKCAIDQLPRIAWLGIPVSEQHLLLEEIGSGVRDAVAAAIEAEKYQMAVEWLEQGRSIVWQNLLKLRTPVDDLRAAHPKLAHQLQSISQKLDAPASRESLRQTPLDRPQEEVEKSHIRLAIEWDELVDKIRTLPSFETFLKPKGFDFLVPAAREGPVVILNVVKGRCDALALVSDGNRAISTTHIPMDNFSLEKSEELLRGLTKLLELSGVRDGDTRAARRMGTKANPSEIFKSILRTLWVDVVKPVMDGLAYQPRTSDLPRIWWCTTGPLAFLPIHAAGDYDKTEVGHKLSDYVVSSYTPTLAAILDSSYPNPPKDFKLLTVAQPSGPGLSEIPKTMDEVEQIAKVATGISVVSLAKEEATIERVRQGMRESNWVHLACHGKQDAAKPMDSGLILHDGTLKLSEIVKENLSNAEFAFLSACQTAMGDEKVEEESVHLAAGMLLAGYRGVIATMWSIRDDDGPRVAEVVYGQMLKDGKPNRREAAYALHDAVRQLRESGTDFTSWVPFIHIGR